MVSYDQLNVPAMERVLAPCAHCATYLNNLVNTQRTPFLVGPPTFLSVIVHKCGSWWVVHACCYFLVGLGWLL